MRLMYVSLIPTFNGLKNLVYILARHVITLPHSLIVLEKKEAKHPFVAAFTNRVNQNTVSQISVLKNQCHVICD